MDGERHPVNLMMSLGDSTASSLGDVSRKRKCTSDDSAGTYGPLPPEQFYAQKERMKVGRAASEIEPIVVNDKRSVELKASSELKRSAPRNCADSSDSSESSSDVSRPKKSKAKKSKKKMKKKKKKSAKRADKRDAKKAASHVVQLGRRDSSDLDNSAVAGEEVSKKRPSVQKPAPALSSPVNMGQKRVLAPMTREDYERQQSIVRRVLDPETGRSRLVKGDGEILEEIVSYKRHKEINKQATKADGAFFEKKVGIEYPQSSKMTR